MLSGFILGCDPVATSGSVDRDGPANHSVLAKRHVAAHNKSHAARKGWRSIGEASLKVVDPRVERRVEIYEGRRKRSIRTCDVSVSDIDIGSYDPEDISRFYRNERAPFDEYGAGALQSRPASCTVCAAPGEALQPLTQCPLATSMVAPVLPKECTCLSVIPCGP